MKRPGTRIVLSRVAREQARLSIALMATTVLAFVASSVLAHVTPVIGNHVAGQIRQHRERNGLLFFDGGYADSGDYVLTGLLPEADFSRGGVYFIGDSSGIVSIMPWELPPAERSLIHNYAIGSLTHREMRHFLQNLAEEQGWLEAGGEKTTVVLNLCWLMAREKPGAEFSVFQRYGRYRFDRERGLRLVPTSPAAEFLRREWVYAHRFLRILTMWPERGLDSSRIDRAAAKARMTRMMGSEWKADMEGQMFHLSALLDYLLERKVRVEAVFTPYPAWHEEMPFPAAYRAMALRVLASRNVPVCDLSHHAREEEFADANHLRYSAQKKIHEILYDLAKQSLRDMGTLQSQRTAGWEPTRRGE